MDNAIAKKITFKIDSAPLDLESRLVSGGTLFDLALHGTRTGGVYDPHDGKDLCGQIASALADLDSETKEKIAAAVCAHIKDIAGEVGVGEIRRLHVSGQTGGVPWTLIAEAPVILARAGKPDADGAGGRALSQDHADMVSGYFDGLKGDGTDVILMHAEADDIFSCRDVCIAVHGGARKKGRVSFSMLDADDESFDSKICRIMNTFSAGTQYKSVVKAARTALDLAEVTGKIARLYGLVRNGNGAVKAAFCVEAPHITSSAVCAEDKIAVYTND